MHYGDTARVVLRWNLSYGWSQAVRRPRPRAVGVVRGLPKALTSRVDVYAPLRGPCVDHGVPDKSVCASVCTAEARTKTAKQHAGVSGFSLVPASLLVGSVGYLHARPAGVRCSVRTPMRVRNWLDRHSPVVERVLPRRAGTPPRLSRLPRPSPT